MWWRGEAGMGEVVASIAESYPLSRATWLNTDALKSAAAK